MAHQLYYTSSAEGLSGYPGFQFVAVSEGLPSGIEHVVSKFLSYRIPPSVPSLPDAEEIERLPVAFSYDQSAYGPVLACCRYLGADYSGRPGNFFGHAVVAAQEELAGVRPIEFWRAPWWAANVIRDDQARTLPTLQLDRPAAVVDPRRVLKEISARDGSSAVLSAMIDATLSGVNHRDGQVTLVSDDVEKIVTWIAAISYSLPFSLIGGLSFITYTAEPEESPYRLIGTTADVWRDRGGRGQVFDLDDLRLPESVHTPGRFAVAIGRSWLRGDLLYIDTVGELADGIVTEPGRSQDDDALEKCETAAALARLCGAEVLDQVDVTRLVHVLRRSPQHLPEQVWQKLAADQTQDYELALAAWRAAGMAGRMSEGDRIGVTCVRRALTVPAHRRSLTDPGGLSGAARSEASAAISNSLEAARSMRDVAEIAWVSAASRVPVGLAAVAEAANLAAQSGTADLEAALVAAPDEYAEQFIRGAITGLEHTSEEIRMANLTSAACRHLDHRDWRPWPHVGRIVLVECAHREPSRRAELTFQALDLTDPLQAKVYEINEMLAAIWPQAPSVQERTQLVDYVPNLQRDKARQALMGFVSRPWNPDTIHHQTEYNIACRIDNFSHGKPTTTVELNAWLVRMLHEIRRGSDRQRYDRVCQVDDRLGSGSPPVAEGVTKGVARAVAAFPPTLQVDLVVARADVGRSHIWDELRAVWLTERKDKHKVLPDLAEIAIRLQWKGRGDGALQAHVIGWASDAKIGDLVLGELYRRDKSLGQGFIQLMGAGPAPPPRRRRFRRVIKAAGGLVVRKYTREQDATSWHRSGLG
jgi:GTPase-associated protein 1, N-terminal domain type 2/GTPase-associated protein 1, middle domain